MSCAGNLEWHYNVQLLKCLRPAEKADLRRIGTVDPIGFGRGVCRRRPVYILQYLVDDPSLWGKRANRVRNPGIFCEQKSLAPAAAEIALATVATSARL